MALDVTLTGGMPWGFRIQGGIDKGQPVQISRVNPVSKASQEGLQEGDIIEAINGQPASTLRNNEAHQLIRNTFDRLRLSIRRSTKKSDPSTSKMFRSSTSIEVNSPTTETPGEFKSEPASTPQSPHSTTIILNPIRTGYKHGKQNSQEVVVDGEPNGTAHPASGKDDASGTPARQVEPDVGGNLTSCQVASGIATGSSPSLSANANSSSKEQLLTSNTRQGTGSTTGERVWSPGSSPTAPRTILKSSLKKEETTRTTTTTEAGEATPVTPVWKPLGQGNSPEKPHFKSVKIDPSTFSKPQERTPPVQENGTTYPPPAPFANPSPPEETAPCVSEARPPPCVPPKTLSLRIPTTDSVSTATSHVYGTSSTSSLTRDSSPPAFTRVNPAGSRLPPYQSPTITLLQKAREGQIPRGAVYIDHKMNSKEEHQPLPPRSTSIGNWWDGQFAVKSEEVYDDRIVTQLEPKKFEGIGPVVKGVPIALCTGVKDENKAEWYKRMYKSLHRAHDGDGRIPYSSGKGYMSEPEPERDDDYYYRKYATLDRRKTQDDYYDSQLKNGNSDKPPSVWNPPSARYSSDIYKNQPKKIEDYEPGRSSIAEMEAKLDDVVDQHGNRGNPQANRPSHAYMFKDGYESDSTLVYRKRGPPDSLSPNEQRAWYKEFQKGGDIPLAGFRRQVPEKPTDSNHLQSSIAATRLELDNVEFGFPLPPPKVPLIDPEPPHRYQASEVNIHYRSPVQNLEKEYVSEDEIRRRQEQMMIQFYEEERRKKALQELVDIENRRHNDNFIPSQKSPIALNRYDNLFEERSMSPVRARTPEPKTAAKASYNFKAQSAKELSFNKGDIIFIHRKIDKNWYEGEHHGLIGLFPVNHVEIIQYDTTRLTARKGSEGQARARYNFHAQTPMELSLIKGENIILTRKVDQNWYEGRIGALKGIFPASYIEVSSEPGIDLQDLRHSPISKPVASPVSHSLIMNGALISPKYNSSSSYSQPSFGSQRSEMYSNPYATMRRYGPARPPGPVFEDKKHPLNQTLHIQTQSDPIPRYRAIYAYKPQNDDELELHEGDTVYVMEKCDDGWYVGSSQRTGLFGTFPGNYVERI